MTRTPTLAHALLALLVFASPAAAQVIIVGPHSGTTPSSSLSTAVQLANDGDTILVNDGLYFGFDLANKSLDVVANQGIVRIEGTARIHSLGPGKEVVISGIQFLGEDFTPGLEITSCVGGVQIVDCLIRGQELSGQTACSIAGCQAVSLLGANIEGGQAMVSFCAEDGGTGLSIAASNVDVYDSLVVGAPPVLQLGGNIGGAGGDACTVSAGSELRAFSTEFRGGDGGSGDYFGAACFCGDGGVGIEVQDPASLVELLASTTTGGFAGFPSGPVTCANGQARIGVVTDTPGPARAIRLDRIAYGGGQLQGEIIGVPGEPVVLILSLHSTRAVLPAYNGVLLVGSPYFARGYPAGVVGASGQLPFSVGVVGFGSSLLAEHMYVQPLFFGSGGRWLGDPDVTTLLAPWL